MSEHLAVAAFAFALAAVFGCRQHFGFRQHASQQAASKLDEHLALGVD